MYNSKSRPEVSCKATTHHLDVRIRAQFPKLTYRVPVHCLPPSNACSFSHMLPSEPWFVATRSLRVAIKTPQNHKHLISCSTRSSLFSTATSSVYNSKAPDQSSTASTSSQFLKYEQTAYSLKRAKSLLSRPLVHSSALWESWANVLQEAELSVQEATNNIKPCVAGSSYLFSLPISKN